MSSGSNRRGGQGHHYYGEPSPQSNEARLGINDGSHDPEHHPQGQNRNVADNSLLTWVNMYIDSQHGPDGPWFPNQGYMARAEADNSGAATRAYPQQVGQGSGYDPRYNPGLAQRPGWPDSQGTTFQHCASYSTTQGYGRYGNTGPSADSDVHPG